MKTMRKANDFYRTPDYTIRELLLNYELQDGWILEPCAGDGAICKALREDPDYSDRTIIGTEIRIEEQDSLFKYCDGVTIGDFLKLDRDDFEYFMSSPPKTIITNPPFSIAQEIIEHCFEIADEDTEIIMLLRLGFLESQARVSFWKEHPNVSLITLAERPSFTGKGTDSTAYGWYIWNQREQFIKPCVMAEERRKKRK